MDEHQLRPHSVTRWDRNDSEQIGLVMALVREDHFESEDNACKKKITSF